MGDVESLGEHDLKASPSAIARLAANGGFKSALRALT